MRTARLASRLLRLKKKQQQCPRAHPYKEAPDGDDNTGSYPASAPTGAQGEPASAPALASVFSTTK